MRFPSKFLSQKFVGVRPLHLKRQAKKTSYPCGPIFPYQTNTPKNNRPVTTVTRSISFDHYVLELLDERRKALRLDRSTYICYVLEQHLGIVDRPLLNEPSVQISPPTAASKVREVPVR